MSAAGQLGEPLGLDARSMATVSRTTIWIRFDVGDRPAAIINRLIVDVAAVVARLGRRVIGIGLIEIDTPGARRSRAGAAVGPAGGELRPTVKTDEKEEEKCGDGRTRTAGVSICRATDLRLVDLAASLSIVHPSETTTLDGRIIMRRSASPACRTS